MIFESWLVAAGLRLWAFFSVFYVVKGKQLYKLKTLPSLPCTSLHCTRLTRGTGRSTELHSRA